MTAPDRKAAFALVYTALILAVEQYFFSFAAIRRQGWLDGTDPASEQLYAGFIWVGSLLLFFVVLPAIIVRTWHREPLAAIGWNASGLSRHMRVYALLYVLVLPLVVLAAQRADFLQKYPFIASARTDLSTFLIWELAYALSFVALEAFFRGYLLFTCAARMGYLAVFVMVVPYTMLHFGKPWLEVMGAIVAGIVLGTLALKFRSFWGGCAVHAAVALTMDTIAVHREGLF